MANWIRIENCLPDKNIAVLCYRGCYIGEMIDVYTYIGNNLWEDSYGYWSRTEDEGITHWMPLPEAPNGIKKNITRG